MVNKSKSKLFSMRLIGLTVLSASSALAFTVWALGDVSLFPITLLIEILVSVLSLYMNKDNLLFLVRTTFIAWIGLVASLAIYMGGYFAYVQLYAQNTEVGFIISVITTLSLFSSQVGIELGKKVRIARKLVDIPRNSYFLVWILLMVACLVGFLISVERGDPVFLVGYASEEQVRTDMPVGNLNAVAILLIFFSLVLYFRYVHLANTSYLPKSKAQLAKVFLFFTGLYVGVWCLLLRGSRMDPLTLVFGIVVLVLLNKNKDIRFNGKVLISLLAAFIFLQLWGGLRFLLHSDDINFNAIKMILTRSNVVGSVPILFHQGTVNNLAVTVAGTVYAIDNGDLDLEYGTTYLEYILKTPPAIIYPDRPKSLAWLMSDLYGPGSGMGGYNEMAEVYLNFGVFGSLFVPGFISFLISYSFRQYLYNRFNILSSLMFLSILAAFFRGLLYETFIFYKVFVTAVVLYFLLFVVHELLLSLKVNKRLGA